jgi:beta-xylosidase
VETVGYKMGDCYGAYQDMGAPQELTREETRELKQRSQPKQAQFAVSADADGKLVFEIPQTENQMDMIRVQM